MVFVTRNDKFRQCSSQNVTPVGSIILDLPPSCIEFVPPHRNNTWPVEEPSFVIGTYDLQKEDGNGEEAALEPKEQSRQGSLSLFKLSGNELTKLTSFRTPSAILDLHFYPDSSTFAVVSSTGSISMFMVQSKLATDNASGQAMVYEYSIIPIITHQVFEQDIIITSFAWDNSLDRDGPRMAVTSNTGYVTLLKFNRTFTKCSILNASEPVSQHSYEAWCTSFSPTGHTIWSGGDDSKLLMARITPGNHDPDEDIMFHDPKGHSDHFPGHSAGVTAILPIPLPSSTEEGNLLLTGSYDDYVRVYALSHPSNNRYKILAELDIGLGGGGVWKLKFLQDYRIDRSQSADDVVRFKVLASCMRVGAKILEITGSKNGNWEIKVVARVGIHESMCYASDVAPIAEDNTEGWSKDRVVVSTSFYDRLLFVWKYDPSGPIKEEMIVEGDQEEQ